MRGEMGVRGVAEVVRTINTSLTYQQLQPTPLCGER